MASGYFKDFQGRLGTLADTSCQSLKTAVDNIYINDGNQPYRGYSCSSDPITAATTYKVWTPSNAVILPANYSMFNYSAPTSAQNEYQMAPFYMDTASAVAISSSILLLCSVAFVFRAVRKFITDDSSYNSD